MSEMAIVSCTGRDTERPYKLVTVLFMSFLKRLRGRARDPGRLLPGIIFISSNLLERCLRNRSKPVLSNSAVAALVDEVLWSSPVL